MSEQDKSETVPVTATPEWLAEQAVASDAEGNAWLLEPNGTRFAKIRPEHVRFQAPRLTSPPEWVAPAIRGWLVQQIEGAYRAGIEAGRKQSLGDCQSVPPDVAAQGFDMSRAWTFARIGDMLGLNREHNDDDEALVSAEIARLRKVAADAEQKATPWSVAKARAEGEKAGYERAQVRLAEYTDRRRARLAHAVDVARAARKAVTEADAEESRLAAEVAGLYEATDALAAEESPF